MSPVFWSLLSEAKLPWGEAVSTTGGWVCLSVRHLVLAHHSHEKLKLMLGAIPQWTRQRISTQGKADAAGRNKANERNAPQAGVISLLGSSSPCLLHCIKMDLIVSEFLLPSSHKGTRTCSQPLSETVHALCGLLFTGKGGAWPRAVR